MFLATIRCRFRPMRALEGRECAVAKYSQCNSRVYVGHVFHTSLSQFSQNREGTMIYSFLYYISKRSGLRIMYSKQKSDEYFEIKSIFFVFHRPCLMSFDILNRCCFQCHQIVGNSKHPTIASIRSSHPWYDAIATSEILR